MRQILVIGYGNPLRGDDGFGGLAAGLLEARRIPGVKVVVSHQLNPELAALLTESSYAIFLDAVDGSSPASETSHSQEKQRLPGTLTAAPVENCDISISGMHHFEPGSLLALAKAVYGEAPPATLIAVTARSFDHSTEISDEVRRAAAKAAEAIAASIRAGKFDAEVLSAALR